MKSWIIHQFVLLMLACFFWGTCGGEETCGGEVIGLQTTRQNAGNGESAKLQIINGLDSPVEVFWQRSDGDEVSNGVIEPGGQSTISTFIGHTFVIRNCGESTALEIEDGQKRRIAAQLLETIECSLPIQAHRVGGIPDFYTQHHFAAGFPIVASDSVNRYALLEAAYIIDSLLAHRPDVRKAMIRSGSRLCILAHNEYTTDQPEWKWLEQLPVPDFPQIAAKDFRDARARGMGGSETDPYCSCGEENLLAYPGDPYSTENILIHELAHNIHLRGMNNIDRTFDARLRRAYESAMRQGLWSGKYASVNHHEYFAEGVQSWFDNNRENDHDHNHVNTRSELKAYDAGLAELCEEVFGATEFRYSKPTERLRDHMEGYNPVSAPTFRWPARLEHAKRAIIEQARNRSRTKQ